MKARIIANPVSGTDEVGRNLADLNAKLRERFDDLDIVLTTGPDDAEQAARRACEEGRFHLFVAGGDGTLNEALNGAASSGLLDHVVFGILPLGTGNDFARAIGIPLELDGAIDAALRGDVRSLDLGRLNGRYFANTSAAGFVAEVSEAVDPTLKTVAGRIAYVIGGARVLFQYDAVGAHLALIEPTPDTDLPPDLSIQMLVVCNGPTIGGGHLIAPRASTDDGLLDVCVVRESAPMGFAALLPRISAGEHEGDPLVLTFRTRRLQVVFDRVVKVNTDGQVLEADRCEYDVAPRAARFIVGTADRPGQV